MTFLSLLIALVLEQAWPSRFAAPVREGFLLYARSLRDKLDGGARRHGAIAWIAAVPLVAVLTAIAGHALDKLGPLAGLLWSVAVLYLTIGFRQFSTHFTNIQKALRAGDLASARDRLGAWLGEPARPLGNGEVARVAIEQGLVASHRNVFGPLAWFVVLGPAGAVLYRASALLAEAWPPGSGPEAGAFGRFAARAFYWIDWLPARLTAACFAIVGDFEDAVYCWRTQAAAWATPSNGVVLAAGGGALGVRLGDALRRADDSVEYRPELGIGDEPDADFMESAVGLIWRTLVVVMFVILVVSFARALG